MGKEAFWRPLSSQFNDIFVEELRVGDTRLASEEDLDGLESLAEVFIISFYKLMFFDMIENKTLTINI